MSKTKKEIYNEIKLCKHEVIRQIKEDNPDYAQTWLNNLENKWLELMKIGFNKTDNLNYGYFLQWSWKIEKLLSI